VKMTRGGIPRLMMLALRSDRADAGNGTHAHD